MKLLADDCQARLAAEKREAARRLHRTLATAARGDWRAVDDRLAECEAVGLAERLAIQLGQLTGQLVVVEEKAE